MKANKSEKEKKSPWSFMAPCYDENSKISAGDNYGVGFRNPVGHTGNPKQFVDALPYGRPDTMQVDNLKSDKLEMYGSQTY